MSKIYTFICILAALFLFVGVSLGADDPSKMSVKTVGTFSLALSEQYAPTSLLYQDLGNGHYSDLKIYGHRLSVAPGIRLNYQNSEASNRKGFLFLEAPVSMFNGTQSRDFDALIWDRKIDGKAVEIGVGLRLGISIMVLKKFSMMAGVSFEKVYLSAQVDETIRTVPQAYQNETGFVVGDRTVAMVGIEFAVSRAIDLSLVLSLPQYDHDGSSLYIKNDINGEPTESQAKLVTNEESCLELKATFNW